MHVSTSAFAARAVVLVMVVSMVAVVHWRRHYTINTINTSTKKSQLNQLRLSDKPPVEITDSTGKTHTIHGRFLHVTDFHPDPYYKEGSSVDELCHSGSGSAGAYGDAILGCDAPMRLVDDTLAWIDANLKDKIDFIVWTGDNIRHDNDRRFPRREQDIFDMNEKISATMFDRFGTLPVPSLGNNDVYPHNLFAPGPTLQTREFFKIWRNFVPQPQLHIFNRGAYFFQEVIPGRLAVLSLNTLYLFKSNPLVDSCDRRKDPGYKLFQWLAYVLKEMRRRKMKVWITGHVPPTPKNYDVSCLRKYIMWVHEYRDVIVGGLFGHMNIDHFVPLDSRLASASEASVSEASASEAENNDEDGPSEADPSEADPSEADTKRREFKENDNKEEVLSFEEDSKKESSETSEAYSDDLDSDSDELSLEDLYASFDVDEFSDYTDANTFDDPVKINAGTPKNKVRYMETVRDEFYSNIKSKKKSGEFSERYSVVHVTASVVPTFNPGIRVWEYNITGLGDGDTSSHETWETFFAKIDTILQDTEEDELPDEAETFKKDKTIPPKMPKDADLGPGHVRQLFTPERYVQYYADLASINSGAKKFGYEVEYSTDDKFYGMKDLTVDEWLKLGRRLANKKEKKGKGKKGKGKKGKKGKGKKEKNERLWGEFLKHSFIDSNYENLDYGLDQLAV